jgi:hypothetical protein
MIQSSLGKKQDPVSKITRAKRAGGVAQAVEHLPGKLKAKKSKHKTGTGGFNQQHQIDALWFSFRFGSRKCKSVVSLCDSV